MEQYVELVTNILEHGVNNEYRNGIRRSLFGQRLVFDMADGFPLVTIKKTNYKAAFDEMLWMLRGNTNINELRYPNTWKQWALTKEDLDTSELAYPVGTPGGIGSIYGREYRFATNSGVTTKHIYNKHPVLGIAPDIRRLLIRQHGDWYYEHVDEIYRDHLDNYVDQLWELVQGINRNPHSTRHRIAVYGPEYAADETLTPQQNIMRGKGSLTACNVFQQYTVSEGRLSLHITQASADVLIGTPYNVVQFSALLHIIANETDLKPGVLYFNIGDAHIYGNQLEQLDASQCLHNEPKLLPELVIEDSFDMWDPDQDKLHVVGYNHHPFVKLEVST